MFFLVWATVTQIEIGRSTPALNAPTERLVIHEPYRLSRNPIEFGALFNYFDFGLLFGIFTHGVTCMILGLFFGSIYHKFIEEKELLLRFGEQYENYRNETLFLIPRLKIRMS